MSSIRERRLASDNGRERRLLDNLGKLERMLEQEEEQALHTCLLAQVVLVDETDAAGETGGAAGG